MTESYAEWFYVLVVVVWGFANTTFFAATFGAMAGAYFGAWAAQRIARSNQQSEQFLDQIRATNTAISLSYGVFNRFLSFKDQIIRPIVKDFENVAKLHDEYKVRRELGEDARFEGEASMLHIKIPSVPTEYISEIVFGKITAPTRTVVMLSEMAEALADMHRMVEMRDSIILKYEQNQYLTDQQRMELYLGLVDEHGNSDDRFPNAIYGISDLTDHCIYYSYSICEDLRKYGVELAKQVGKKAPSIVQIILSEELVERNLMPDMEQYQGWNDSFATDIFADQNENFLDRLKFWKH